MRGQQNVSGFSANAPWATTMAHGFCCVAASTCVMRAPSIAKKRAPARPGHNDSSGQDLKLRVEGGRGSRPASGEATGRDVRTATSLAGKRRNTNPVRPGLECHLRSVDASNRPGRDGTCFEMSFFSQSCAKPHAAWLAGRAAGQRTDADAARSRVPHPRHSHDPARRATRIDMQIDTQIDVWIDVSKRCACIVHPGIRPCARHAGRHRRTGPHASRA